MRIDAHFAHGHNARYEISVSIYCFVKIEVVKSCVILTNAVVAEIVVIAVDFLQASEFNAVNVIRIAVPAVGYRNTVNISFAVCPCTCEQSVTHCALKNAVNEIIVMSCCGNGLAPVNYGVTYIAVCSACVACFCAGCCLIGKCNDCMLMPRCNGCSTTFIAFVDTYIAFSTHRFAVYLNLCRRECSERAIIKCYETCFCNKLNIHRIYALLLRYYPVGVLSERVMRIPSTHGN